MRAMRSDGARWEFQVYLEPGPLLGRPNPAVGELGLQRREERFGHGVVPANPGLPTLCKPEAGPRRENTWQRVSSSRTTTDNWCVTSATPTVAASLTAGAGARGCDGCLDGLR